MTTRASQNDAYDNSKPLRLCDTCRGWGAEMIENVGEATIPSGGLCPDCGGTGQPRTEKESPEDKILSEFTEITVRVVRNGVVKSGTRVIPDSLIESLIPSLLAMEFETLSRDVAKAAGLPVPDQKPTASAGDLAVAAEDALKKLAQVVGPHLSGLEATWLRCALHDVGDLKALPLDEFLREDGK